MGTALRPFLAGCALTAVVLGTAWWLHAGMTPQEPPAPPAVAAPGDATKPPPDTTIATGVAVDDSQKPAAKKPVVVRVRDAEDDHPIAGAHVVLRTGGDEAPQDVAAADTDADGVAKFPAPAGDERGDVLVKAAGHVHGWHRADAADADAAEIVVGLDRAGRVRGVVRGSDGKPIDGASVHAEIEGHADWPDDESVTSAGGGIYEIDSVEVGADFSVYAEHDGRSGTRDGLVVKEAGEVVAADVTIAAPAFLRVRVLWPDGLPLAGASIELQPANYAAESDASGRAEFHDLTPGPQHVAVTRHGFADAAADVELAPGETKSIDVRPVPNLVLSGVVVDDAGFPVAGATVALDAPSDVNTKTLADGKFRIACTDEDSHDLAVSEPSHCDATFPGARAPAEDLRIVLPRRPKIRCRIVLPGGASATASRAVAAWWNNLSVPATLDRGVLTIVVSPGPGRASFQVGGFVVTDREADPAPGQVVEWGDVTLAAAPKLTGRVVDTKGRPVDAFIYPKVGSAQVPLTSTDKTGAFSFDGLPPGDAVLSVEAKGFVDHVVHYEFTPEAKPVVIVLERGGGVRGIVVDANGRPAPKAVYVGFKDLDDPENRDRMSFPSIGDDGRFECRLHAGRYEARTTLDATEAVAEVVVVEGESREIRLRLK